MGVVARFYWKLNNLDILIAPQGLSTQVSFFRRVRISPSGLRGRGFKKEIEVFREIIHIRGIKRPQSIDLQRSPSSRTKRRTCQAPRSSHVLFILLWYCPFSAKKLPQSQRNNENALASDEMAQTYRRAKMFLWHLRNARLPRRSIYSSRRRAFPRRQNNNRAEERTPLARCRTHNLKWMPVFALHHATVRPQMLRLMHARQPRTLQQADELC